MKRFSLENIRAVAGRALAMATATFWSGGCAVHYRDAATGVEHVWGVGHLRMKTQVETGRPQAVVSGVETAGLTLGLGHGGTYLNVGINRRNITEVAPEGANVRVEWPEADFYRLKVDRVEIKSAGTAATANKDKL